MSIAMRPAASDRGREPIGRSSLINQGNQILGEQFRTSHFEQQSDCTQIALSFGFVRIGLIADAIAIAKFLADTRGHNASLASRQTKRPGRLTVIRELFWLPDYPDLIRRLCR